MRTTRIAMVGLLVLVLAGMAFAQATTCPSPGATGDQMSAQALRASVQPGPYVGTSRIPSADVFVNGKFALRIPSSAGGLSPLQRGEIVADRMNSAFDAGYTWNDLRVQPMGGLWTVAIGDQQIVTADANSARAMGVSTGMLAGAWARQSVVALGGEPAMIAQQLTPSPGQMVAGSRQELAQPTWGISPSKSVPLLDASTGSQNGNITVAGPADVLDDVNAVAFVTTSFDGATAYTFVPIRETSVGTSMTRVNGVGVVSLAPDVVPGIDMSGAADYSNKISSMGTCWNAAINSNLSQQRLQVLGNTRIVPLFSADGGRVIGAAQIVGRANDVSMAKSVRLSSDGSMYGLSAMSSAPGAPVCPDSSLRNVVVTAIILPTGTAPSATAPSAEPATPATPGSAEPSPGGTCPAGEMPPAPPASQ